MRERNSGGADVLAAYDDGRSDDKERGDNADCTVDEVECPDAAGIQGNEGVLRRGRQEDGGNENQGSSGERGERASVVTCPRRGHSFNDLPDGFRQVVIDHIGGSLTEGFERQRGTGAHPLGGQRRGLVEESARRGSHRETIVCGLITECSGGFNEPRQEFDQRDRLRDRDIASIHAIGNREWNHRHSTRCFRCHWILPVAA